MNALICKQCGSNDLRMVEGVAVCQHCNTRYSFEDMRRILSGNQVGTSAAAVRPEDLTRLDKLYILARRAKKDNNLANAIKYYDLIQEEDPSSWEAAFYGTFYASLRTNIAGIENAASGISNSFNSVLELIRDSDMDKKEKYIAIYEMIYFTSKATNLLANGAKKHYYGISSDPGGRYKSEARARVLAAAEMLFNLGEEIEEVFEKDEFYGVFACFSWRAGMDFLTNDSNKKLFNDMDSEKLLRRITSNYIERIARYDENEKYNIGREALLLKHAELQEKLRNLDQTISEIPTTRFGNLSSAIALLVTSAVLYAISLLFDGGLIDAALIGFAGFCLLGGIVLCKPLPDREVAQNKVYKEEYIRQHDELVKELYLLEDKLNRGPER